MSETEAQTTKKRTKKDDYIVQGSILAAAAVLTKIIGVVYRIPLTNILEMKETDFMDMPIRSMQSL